MKEDEDGRWEKDGGRMFVIILLIPCTRIKSLLPHSWLQYGPSRSKRLPCAEVLLAVVISVSFLTPVQRSPLGLLLEQAHSLDVLQQLLANPPRISPFYS